MSIFLTIVAISIPITIYISSMFAEEKKSLRDKDRILSKSINELHLLFQHYYYEYVKNNKNKMLELELAIHSHISNFLIVRDSFFAMDAEIRDGIMNVMIYIKAIKEAIDSGNIIILATKFKVYPDVLLIAALGQLTILYSKVGGNIIKRCTIMFDTRDYIFRIRYESKHWNAEEIREHRNLCSLLNFPMSGIMWNFKI